MTLLHMETCFAGLALLCFQLLVYAPDVHVYDSDPTPLSSHSTGLGTESKSTTSSHNFPNNYIYYQPITRLYHWVVRDTASTIRIYDYKSSLTVHIHYNNIY